MGRLDRIFRRMETFMMMMGGSFTRLMGVHMFQQSMAEEQRRLDEEARLQKGPPDARISGVDRMAATRRLARRWGKKGQ